MAWQSWVVIALLAPLFGSLAAADPHNYVQAGLGDLYVVCDLPPVPGLGGVCIPSGHMNGDSNGEVLLSILDDNVVPVSGIYCQDWNGDLLCGGPEDPAVAFCGSVTITSGIDWRTSLPAVIRVDGPIYGNPILSPCGTASIGTLGSVIHGG